jgi:dihydrodipicolinate synthase/N-acetylneuraminate lyase
MVSAVSPEFPIYVYHNPAFSGYEISLDTMKKLKEKGVHGIKDATFNILTFATYMRELSGGGFDIALGTEALWLSACGLGAEAYIPGLGNAFPEICGRLYEEGMRNDTEKCRKTQFEVNKIRDIMYIARSTQLSIYAMLDIRGVMKAYPRSPFVPATQKEVTGIRNALQDLGMI